MPESVAVFLDFQNVHLTGHGLFGIGSEPYRTVPDPARLAVAQSRSALVSHVPLLRQHRQRDPRSRRALIG